MFCKHIGHGAANAVDDTMVFICHHQLFALCLFPDNFFVERFYSHRVHYFHADAAAAQLFSGVQSVGHQIAAAHQQNIRARHQHLPLAQLELCARFIHFPHILAVCADIVDSTVVARSAFAHHPVKLYLVTWVAHNGIRDSAHHGQIFKAGVRSAVKAGAKARVGGVDIHCVVLIGTGDVELIQRTARDEGGHGVYERRIATQCQPCRHAEHVGLTNAHVYKAIRVRLLEADKERGAA